MDKNKHKSTTKNGDDYQGSVFFTCRKTGVPIIEVSGYEWSLSWKPDHYQGFIWGVAEGE